MGRGRILQVCRCQVEAPYTATRTGDCNDGEPTVAPNKPESATGWTTTAMASRIRRTPPAASATTLISTRMASVSKPTTAVCAVRPARTSRRSQATCNDYNASINPGRAQEITATTSTTAASGRRELVRLRGVLQGRGHGWLRGPGVDEVSVYVPASNTRYERL